ncbi:hypothetical protein [Sphingopyxis panaciterrulae]|jgi:hypothetical protein|uniref:Uncharacterized protein n=1 Tax=Sphingopyxis panaciterrulae TaxID=462372 RepID=A0A7W9EQE0_9SPHN|nr:hypothetical protein [Sphingopyxis panaciterrulae]MBB5706572.1 hypothetical protein [Sphingopyxis panaciterrulae]
MNLVPSDLPRPDSAASMAKPGFDIILAVSSARQTALPTVRLLRARAQDESHAARLTALREMLGGHAGGARSVDRGPVRFFDLSEAANGPSQTMNSLFTRGFQPMLNPSDIDQPLSVEPIPPVEDFME